MCTIYIYVSVYIYIYIRRANGPTACWILGAKDIFQILPIFLCAISFKALAYSLGGGAGSITTSSLILLNVGRSSLGPTRPPMAPQGPPEVITTTPRIFTLSFPTSGEPPSDPRGASPMAWGNAPRSPATP